MSDDLDEIWTLYADDGIQSLDNIEAALFSLRESPADSETIASLFRAYHTFKGNARTLGLAVIESRAHLAEDLIGAVRDDGVPLDGEMQALLLEIADALRDMLEESASQRRDVSSDTAAELAQRMQEKRDRCYAVAPAADPEGEVDTIEDAETPGEPEEPPVPLSVDAGLDTAEPEGTVLEPAHKTVLAEDPVYRRIFAEMAEEAFRNMRQALDASDATSGIWHDTLRSEVESLRYAADQIGLPEWPDVLAGFQALSEPSQADAQGLLGCLESLRDRDFPAVDEAPVHDEIRRFFDDLEPLLATAMAMTDRIAAGGTVDPEDLRRVAEDVRARAEPLGFGHVVEVADRQGARAGASAFRRFELELFEALAAIERELAERLRGARVQPAVQLQSRCAARAFNHLLELGKHLESLRRHEGDGEPWGVLQELLRLVGHACRHHGLDAAAQLSLALVDLFARIEAGAMALDPVLIHIARSYVSAMDLVFRTVDAGGVPDMAAIEALFGEASNVAFTTSGAMSAAAVEARLGLPPSFHRVLTPESVQVAADAIEKGYRFYVVRADLNLDEEAAGHFLSWMNSDTVTAISNVTVFEEEATLFDFLVGAALDEAQLAEALAVLDPPGRALKIEMVLGDRHASAGKGYDAAEATSPGGATRVADAQDTVSGDMVEAIGEVVAGQAIVHHMLTGLGDEDYMRAVEAAVRDAGGEWSKAQAGVRDVLDGLSARIEKVLQAEAQMDTHLKRLQEEVIGMRARPATLLLKPLEIFAEATARQHDRRVAVSSVGDDVEIDHTILEQLKGPLRRLVAFCVTGERAASAENDDDEAKRSRHLRIRLDRQNDHIVVTVEDNGSRDTDVGDFEDIQAGLRSQGGDLRVVALPTGGVRFHVTVPLAMAVIDGMVVRVGEVRYVVPIDAIQRIVYSATQEIVRVSADHGRLMLKLGKEDIVPIRFLGTGDTADDDTAVPALDDETKHLFLIVGKKTNRIALSVDELEGQQIVLIRPLQGYLAGIRGVTGCVLLGGGEVGMVLDMGHVLSLA